MNYIELSDIKNRHAKLIEEMVKQDLSAVLIMNSDNITYYSGYWLGAAFFGTWERPAMYLITPDGMVKMVLNEIFRNSIHHAKSLNCFQIQDVLFYAEHPNTRKEPTDWVSVLQKICRDADLENKKIGIDMPTYSLPPVMTHAIPQVELFSIGDFIEKMRYQKDPSELRLIRLMGELSDWAQEVFHENLIPGCTCSEVSERTQLELRKKIVDDYPHDKHSLLVFCHAGPDSINIPNAGYYYGRKIEPGDSVINILACRINGYGVENERTFMIGEPSKEQKTVFEIMKEAQWAGVESCVDGVPILELDRRPREIIQNAGYGDYIQHRAGHGIGINIHEYPLDTAFNTDPLLERAVMSSEPGIYVPGIGGFRHSDTIIVGKSEPILVTNYPRDMEYLTIPANY